MLYCGLIKTRYDHLAQILSNHTTITIPINNIFVRDDDDGQEMLLTLDTYEIAFVLLSMCMCVCIKQQQRGTRTHIKIPFELLYIWTWSDDYCYRSNLYVFIKLPTLITIKK